MGGQEVSLFTGDHEEFFVTAEKAWSLVLKNGGAPRGTSEITYLNGGEYMSPPSVH